MKMRLSVIIRNVDPKTRGQGIILSALRKVGGSEKGGPKGKGVYII